MTSLDDAETDLIRELEVRGAARLAEELVAIRRRRGQVNVDDTMESSPWISDFRHVRALAYWTLVQIERRYGRIYVRARQDIGDDWNEGIGADLGLAIDDLILLVARDGNHDLTVSDETMRSLIEIRQERGREQDALEIDEDLTVVLTYRDPNSATCEVCEGIIREGDVVHVDAEGLHFCATCYEHANEPAAGRVETEIEEINERTRREMVAAGEAAPPGPPTAGEVYALLEVGDHVVLNGIEYVVAMPCGPGFRTSVRTRPITGGIIEDVTFEAWIAQNGRKRDPSEYMPAPANEEGGDNAR